MESRESEARGPVCVWEHYAEYRAAQQYGRCLERILASLPVDLQLKLTRPFERGAVLMARGIAGAHAEARAGVVSRAQREAFRQGGLESVAVSRDGLRMLREEGLGDRANMAAAFELLDRVEEGLRRRPLPGARPSGG